MLKKKQGKTIWQLQQSFLTNELAPKMGMRVVETKADGNCLYYSVCGYLAEKVDVAQRPVEFPEEDIQ